MTTNFYLNNATVEIVPVEDSTVLNLVEYDGAGRLAFVVHAKNAQTLLAIAAVLRATAVQHGATETGEDEHLPVEVSDARGM